MCPRNLDPFYIGSNLLLNVPRLLEHTAMLFYFSVYLFHFNPLSHVNIKKRKNVKKTSGIEGEKV